MGFLPVLLPACMHACGDALQSSRGLFLASTCMRGCFAAGYVLRCATCGRSYLLWGYFSFMPLIAL